MKDEILEVLEKFYISNRIKYKALLNIDIENVYSKIQAHLLPP